MVLGSKVTLVFSFAFVCLFEVLNDVVLSVKQKIKNHVFLFKMCVSSFGEGATRGVTDAETHQRRSACLNCTFKSFLSLQ